MVALVLDGLVGFPAGLSPTSFYLSPSSFHLSLRLGACGRVPGWLVSHFLSFSVLVVRFLAGLSPTSLNVSPASFHLSPRLGACSRVSGRLVSHFLAFVSHFFPKQFTVGVSPFFLVACPQFVSLLVSAHFHWPCNISIHPSPRCVTAGVRPFPLAMQHFYSCVSQVCHWWCPPFSAGRVAFLFICLPGLSLLAMQHFYSFVPQVCHLRCPPFSAGDATFLFICFPGLSLLMSHFCSFVSQACHWWCPPFSAGHVAFLFICLPHLSLLVSAPFRWPCSISIHLSPRSVTAGVRPFLLAM